MTAALDVYRVPLVGLNLIEASAGTGKTWSLCGLYLRLLLEKELDVRRILVVTFTNAATAELRARIRARISDALDILRPREATQREAPVDAELAMYLDTLAATADSTSLMRRLVLARESFDEAAIFTIHGFCQRALADTPFSGGLPFAFEALEDDEEYRLREAQDFWRRRVAQLDGACMAHLLDGGDTPASYAAYLGKRLAKPLAKVEWPPLPDTPVEPDFAALAASFATLRAAWSAGELEPPAVLNAALEILKGQSYKPESIAEGAREWRAWFATEDPLHRKHDARQAKFPLYRTSKLTNGTRKGQTAGPPTHPFFDAAEAFLTLQASYLQALHEKRLQLLREFLASATQALGARKRQERVVAFNDMLANLHDALDAGGNPGLAAALRERFPVALIDEFQDTDPLQFEIFRLIHGEENHLREFPVFLVGDPKQAIYSFRNADLHTYLMAASQVSARHVLGVNRRSTPALVESCNGLFGHNPHAFLQPGIAFMPAAADPRRHDPLHDESSAPRACFEVWWLPRDAEGDWLSLSAARVLCAERTAAEIARLLAEQARLQLDGRGLRASDIAVLVRTHAEGRLVRQALASRHISCVEMSPASVLRTLEAEELERVLMAIAHRGEGLLRGAVASNFMGGSAEAILALSTDSQAFLALIQRFAAYREVWQKQGFAVMFRRFLREESVQAHTLIQPDGERRLTNLLHLGELLGEAALLHPAPDALLRWFRSQRSQPGTAPEAAQMRLESDDKLVRIVTIHKSKGLEYPVVFCPFLWMGGRGGRMELPLLREYHAAGRAVLDFGTPAAESDEVKEQRSRDADAEFMRLIYVALTRASRRCYLMAGLCREGNGSVPAGSLRSHLNWLVAGAGMTPAQWFSKDENSCTPDDVWRAWLALAGRCPIEVSELPDITVPRADDTAPAAMLASRRGEPPRVREAWTRGSFTALTRHLHARDKVADHDVQILPLPEVSELPASLAPDDILRFPRGANAGSCLHRVFELIDFTRDDEWDAAIERGLREFPQGAPDAESPLHAAMLRRMLGDVLACPLQENLRLDGIARTDRLNELAFTVSAPGLAVDDLNALLLDAGYLRERLPAHGWRGFLSGAIDLVFRHHGRIYLLDWKSNFLGESSEDYARAGMEQEMHRHAYHLQHLLYTVALRRYLKVRQPGYDHARDFGGVFYLFVRGVRPQWRLADGSQAGVFFERAPDALVTAIDRCLDEASLRTA